ncbi:MAG: hypothetical protein WCC99_04320 [Candidatus Sulfotelmatobacter sp.]
MKLAQRAKLAKVNNGDYVGTSIASLTSQRDATIVVYASHLYLNA